MQDGLGTVRVETDNLVAIEGSQNLDPFGNLIDLNGTIGTPYGFTGELVDGGGLLDMRARRYNAGMGVFASLDPFEGVIDAPMSLNGYGYVEGNPINDAVGELLAVMNGYNYVGGNPVNRVDPSGMCWVNDSASPEQQSECYDAWLEYTNIITDTYTQSWPRDVQILVTQEAKYWGNLSYEEFAIQWNNNVHSASTNPSGEVLQSSLPIIAGVSLVNPGPGPEDVLALGGLCIVAIWAIVANGSTITLPTRPLIGFGDNIFFTKRGNQQNEYSRAAQEAARTRNIDPCDYLTELYKNTTDTAEKRKIITAQKVLNCRKHRK